MGASNTTLENEYELVDSKESDDQTQETDPTVEKPEEVKTTQNEQEWVEKNETRNEKNFQDAGNPPLKINGFRGTHGTHTNDSPE